MGFFSSIGGVLGGIVGSVIAPGVGTVIGSGLGGVLGGGAETLINKNNADNKYSDAMGFAQSQYQFQQDYIKNAMQWRAEDAKKAGYHPMAALGFSSPSFSPVSAPQYSGYSDSNTIDPMEFGQSLNYASAKAKTAKQQEQAFNLTSEGMRLDNQGKQIQNEIAATELLSMQAQLRNSGPSAPTLAPESQHVPGQADSGDTSILGKSSHRLFNIAMHGDSAVLVLNPEISDGISESMVSNTIASIVREVETGNNPDLVDEIISHFPKGIRRAIANGEMRLASIPGSGAFRAVPVGPNESFNRYNVFGIN